MNKSSLSIILGAGFSKNAGLPLANEIKQYFIRDNSEKIGHFTSNECAWIDSPNETSFTRHLKYGYLLNTLVKRFIDKQGSYTNYEDMYQFFLDNLVDDNFLSSVLAEAKKNYNVGNPQSPDSSSFTGIGILEITNLINYLIADLLVIRKNYLDFKSSYDNFFNFMSNKETVTITTLNHDILLETFLKKYINRPYSDGFTKKQSVLFSEKNEPLSIFQTQFNESISLIKLHGSIDIYKYPFYEREGNSTRFNRTGEYLYYKTSDYNEKQKPIRHDPSNGNIVQSIHSEIDPKFITGTNKKKLIETDQMYAALYKKFSADMASCYELLIIGYSYGDKHVDEQIELALKSGNLKKIININPCKAFPFRSSKIVIENLKSISELPVQSIG